MSQTHPEQPHATGSPEHRSQQETAAERRHAAEEEKKAAEAEKKAANGKPKARTEKDKAHDAQMALALLLTDWLHGDRHFQTQLTELALDMLEGFAGDLAAQEPTEEQLLAQEAIGRIEGMPTGIRPAQYEPAVRQDERRRGAATPQPDHAVPTKTA